MWTSFSTVVGGGVRGKGDGIARGTIIQVGATIETFHLFIEGYHQVGGMTIGIIVGEGINGTINEYPTNKSNGTGATGRRTDIGRSKTLGVSKVCNPERDHNSRLERFNKNLRQNCNLERQPNRDKRDPNLKRLNRNLERQPNHNNLNLNRGNLKEARKKNRIESRMTKGSPDIV
jgi:hypothetical protein